MVALKEIPNIQISYLPDYFILCAIKHNKKRNFGLSDQGFFKQILKRYQLKSTFFNLSLYFLYFQKRSEFLTAQSLMASFFPSLSILFKNFFSFMPLINTQNKVNNVIAAVAEKDLPIHKFAFLNKHWFSDSSFLPVSPLSSTEKIQPKIHRKNLHFYESSYRFPPASAVSIFLPYTGLYNRKAFRLEKVKPTLTLATAKVMPFMDAHSEKHELPLKDARIHSGQEVIKNEISPHYNRFTGNGQNAGKKLSQKYLNPKIPYIDRKSLISRHTIDFQPMVYFSSNPPKNSADAIKKAIARKSSISRYTTDFQPIVYFSPNLIKNSADVIKKAIDRKLLLSRHTIDFQPMVYFSSNPPKNSADVIKKAEENLRSASLHSDSSPPINPKIPPSVSVPEIDLFNLADRVYGLIVERVKREREMRGH